MSAKINVTTYAVVGIFGTLGILFTLWLPWTFLDAELVAKKSGIDFPHSDNLGANQAMKSLMSVFSQVQTGKTGVVNLGLHLPSWIFVLCAFAGGVLSILTLVERLSVDRRTLIMVILIPSAILGIWLWQQVRDGAVIQSGSYVAALSIGLILFAAIKTKTEDNKSAMARPTLPRVD